jgi:hypothetical protein
MFFMYVLHVLYVRGWLTCIDPMVVRPALRGHHVMYGTLHIVYMMMQVCTPRLLPAGGPQALKRRRPQQSSLPPLRRAAPRAEWNGPPPYEPVSPTTLRAVTAPSRGWWAHHWPCVPCVPPQSWKTGKACIKSVYPMFAIDPDPALPKKLLITSPLTL